LDEIIQEIELYMMNIDCLFFKINNSLTNTFNFGTICNNKNVIKTSYPIIEEDNEEDNEDDNEDDDEDDGDIDVNSIDTEYLVNDDTDNNDNLDTDENDQDQDDDNVEGDEDDDNVEQVVTNYITMKLDTYIGKKGIVHKCKVCDYNTPKYPSYEKHLLTQKHKKNILKSKNLDVNPNIENTFVNNINKLMKRITLLEQSNKQLREENDQFKNKINKDIVTLKKTISLL
jgi:hypothetical protein